MKNILLDDQSTTLMTTLINEFIQGAHTGNIQLNFQAGVLKNINKEIKETIPIKLNEVKK